MSMTIDASCGCSTGRIRSNNEDNLYFDGRTLELDHNGLRHPMHQEFSLTSELFFAVFDGMGGEESGELASYTAARAAGKCLKASDSFIISPRSLLEDLCAQMNEEVCAAANPEMGRMGTTVVSFLFTPDEAYVCNIGDSRAYRLRDGELIQLSKDHSEAVPPCEKNSKRKPRLTQHLGIFPDELTIEPFIAKGELQTGDQYLLCSDGITDMLSNIEICAILKDNRNTKRCIEKLIDAAMENGGRDNISVILCRVK